MHQNRIYNRLINLFLLLFLFKVTLFACILPQLPDDEDVGEEWVREGLISEPLWELIKPYYTQRLSVAEGELSEIPTLFDEFNCNLPTQNIVRDYLPWSEVTKSNFLERYPFLQSILPILSFNSRELPKRNRIIASTSISESYRQDPVDSKVKFTTHPHEWFMVMGNIQFTDEKFRWYSREFKYDSKSVLLSIGNFRSPLTNGLFYGYFPNLDTVSTASDNWKYSEKNGWNGALLCINTKRNRFNFVTHKRYGETTELFIHNLKTERGFEVNNTLGLSFYRYGNMMDTSINLTTKIGVNSETIRVNITAGITADEYQKIPVVVLIGRSVEKGDYSLSLTYLPKGFCVPSSLTLKNAKSRLKLVDNFEQSIFMLENSYRMSRLKILTISSDISYLFTLNHDNSGGEHYNFRADFGLNIRKKNSTALRYYYEKSTSSSNRYKVDLKSELSINDIVKIIPIHNLYIKDGEYARFSTDLKLAIITSRIEFYPSVKFYANSNSLHSVKLKLGQKIIISDKTYGEYRLSFTPTNQKNKRTSFYATLSFYF